MIGIARTFCFLGFKILVRKVLLSQRLLAFRAEMSLAVTGYLGLYAAPFGTY